MLCLNAISINQEGQNTFGQDLKAEVSNRDAGQDLVRWDGRGRYDPANLPSFSRDEWIGCAGNNNRWLLFEKQLIGHNKFLVLGFGETAVVEKEAERTDRQSPPPQKLSRVMLK